MTEPLPSVSVVIETANWEEASPLGLWDALSALERQSWPRERLQVLVVLTAPLHAQQAEIERRHPSVQVAPAPPGLTYYQVKDLGASLATGEILVMLDCDVLPVPDWLAQAVQPFLSAGPEVGIVQGVCRFQKGFLSWALDTIWWPRGFQSAGLLDRAYASNNIAYRTAAYRQAPFPSDDYLTTCGLEAPQSRKLRESGYRVWLSSGMRVEHAYHGSARQLLQLGRRRGYDFLMVRLRFPSGAESILRKLGPIAPIACWPLLQVKDLFRLMRSAVAELRGMELLKVPLYALFQVPFNVFMVIGMYEAIFRPHRIPPIHFAGGSSISRAT